MARWHHAMAGACGMLRAERPVHMAHHRRATPAFDSGRLIKMKASQTLGYMTAVLASACCLSGLLRRRLARSDNHHVLR